MQRTNMFKSASRNSQLLLLDQKCAKCLLETYVKRSLSLNEGCRKHKQKRLNRVKRDERESQARRASSDTSTHRLSVEKHLKISKCTECTTSAFDLRCESPKGPSKTKRRSLFRGFLNRFSKKKSDLKVNGEGVSETDCGQSTIERGIGHSKSLRKKHSLKKILFSNQNDEQRDFTLVPGDKEGISDEEGSFEDVDQKRLPLDVAPKFMLPKPGQSRLRSPGFSPLPPARLAAFGSVRSASVSSVSSNQSNDSTHSDLCRSSLSVGSSNTYFETVSEELESIVKKIQFSPKDDRATLPSAACLEDYRSAGDDTTERIISLLKQHGDIIDQKISKNKSVQDFLQKLTYSSFQQLADHYVAEIPSPLPQTTDASPELVRLAFTLDFTAKVAGLCSQTVGRIMGFGYQYLQDSFTQMCAAHRQVPEDLEGQNNCDPD